MDTSWWDCQECGVDAELPVETDVCAADCPDCGATMVERFLQEQAA